MGLGIALTGFLPTFYGLIFTTILMSFGFHYYETTSQSLILQHFSSIQAPLVMARFRSYVSLTNLSVGAVVFTLFLCAGLSGHHRHSGRSGGAGGHLGKPCVVPRPAKPRSKRNNWCCGAAIGCSTP